MNVDFRLGIVAQRIRLDLFWVKTTRERMIWTMESMSVSAQKPRANKVPCLAK